MKCLDCQELLQRRLDGLSVADDKELERHLAGCVSCREQHAATTRLLQGLARMQMPLPSPDLARRVAAAALGDRAQRRRRMTRRLYVTAALAASVFLMLLVSYSLQPPVPGPAHLENPGALAQKDRVETAPRIAEDASAPALPGTLVDSLSALLPDVSVNELPAMAELEPLDPAAQSLKEAGREVTASLQTVTRSARQAFDYFSRELPAFDLTMRE